MDVSNVHKVLKKFIIRCLYIKELLYDNIKGNQLSLYSFTAQVTKIGRDAVLYVESLIESIMGGLEGLINILDSEGGFGALEIQVLFVFHLLR